MSAFLVKRDKLADTSRDVSKNVIIARLVMR